MFIDIPTAVLDERMNSAGSWVRGVPGVLQTPAVGVQEIGARTGLYD